MYRTQANGSIAAKTATPAATHVTCVVICTTTKASNIANTDINTTSPIVICTPEVVDRSSEW